MPGIPNKTHDSRWTELALLWRPQATEWDVHRFSLEQSANAAFAVYLGKALGRLHSDGVIIDAQPGNFMLAPDGSGLILTDISFPVIRTECEPTDFATLGENLVAILQRQSPPEWALFKTAYLEHGGSHAPDLIRWVEAHEAEWWLQGGLGNHDQAVEAINEAIRRSTELGRTIILTLARARQQIHLGRRDDAMARCQTALQVWDSTFDVTDRLRESARVLCVPVGERPFRVMQALHVISSIDAERAQEEFTKRHPRLVELDTEWTRAAENPPKMHGPEEAVPTTPCFGSVVSIEWNDKGQHALVRYRDDKKTYLAAISWPKQVVRWRVDITDVVVVTCNVHDWVLLRGDGGDLRLLRADAPNEESLRWTICETQLLATGAAALPGNRIAILADGRYVELDSELHVRMQLELPPYLRVGFQTRGLFPVAFSAEAEIVGLVYENGLLLLNLLAPTEAAMILTDAVQPVGLRPAGAVPNPINPLAHAVTTHPDDPSAIGVIKMPQFTVEVAVWQSPLLWLFGHNATRLWYFTFESSIQGQLCVTDIWPTHMRPEATADASTVTLWSRAGSLSSGDRGRLVELAVSVLAPKQAPRVTVRHSAETKAAALAGPRTCIGVRTIHGGDYLREIAMREPSEPLPPVEAVGMTPFPVRHDIGPLESLALGTWTDDE